MADKALVWGATGGFGALTGWALQDADPNQTHQRANVLDADGNESASQTYDDKTDVTSNYIAEDSTAAIPTAVGVLLNGYVLTSIAIGTDQNGFKTMALSGHNHGTNAHDSTSTLQSYTHGISLGGAFGATDYLTGADTSSVASVKSSSLTISCDHNDVAGASGEHEAGENFNGKIEASTTWNGTLTTLAAAGWDVTGNSQPTANQTFKTQVVTAMKAIAADT